jgi:MFS family permease
VQARLGGLPRGCEGAVSAVLSAVRPVVPWAAATPPGVRAISSSIAAMDAEKVEPSKVAEEGGISGWLIRTFGGDKERADKEAPPNRWLMMLPAFLTHMCIGHPYAWSVMSGPLSRELGVVGAAAADWSLAETTLPISLVFAFQGLSAAIGGPWLAKVGPRAGMTIAACCFAGGLSLAAAGIATHSLPLLYLGYGVLGGTGVGFGYTPPIQTLIDWFPDRRGIASGVTIAGFGSGALLFTPLAQHLLKTFQAAPDFAGTLADSKIVREGGKMFVEAAGSLREVVQVGAAELADSGFQDLQEGLYYVGTGSTGAASTLAVFAGLYGLTMAASAMAIRRPWQGYTVDAPTSPSAVTDDKPKALAPIKNVHTSVVLKTPQFWLLASTFFAVASGGIALLSVAKPLVKDVFLSAGAVSSGFAATYLMLLSVGNLGGRLGWAAVSDAIGRRATFVLFTVGSIPIYLSAPYLVDQVVNHGSQTALVGFCATTTLAISFMGGTYALLPAYESDMFGSKHVGPNHGKMLLASTAAALAGPMMLMGLRGASTNDAIQDLLGKADPSKFQDIFGAPVSAAQDLIASKALTIGKLLEACPAGTPDPTPFIYDSTMYSMTGLMAAAAVAHMMVRPVNPKFFEDVTHPEPKAEPKVVEAEPSEPKA